jgi:hypothetical protein
MTVVLSLMAIVSIPGLVLVDRIGLAANTRFPPWRKSADGRPLAAAGVDELHALFFSAKRHELDQRRSSLLLRDEEATTHPPEARSTPYHQLRTTTPTTPLRTY